MSHDCRRCKQKIETFKDWPKARSHRLCCEYMKGFTLRRRGLDKIIEVDCAYYDPEEQVEDLEDPITIVFD